MWKILRSGHIAYGLDENLARYRRSGKTLSSNKLEALRRIWIPEDTYLQSKTNAHQPQINQPLESLKLSLFFFEGQAL